MVRVRGAGAAGLAEAGPAEEPGFPGETAWTSGGAWAGGKVGVAESALAGAPGKPGKPWPQEAGPGGQECVPLLTCPFLAITGGVFGRG